MILLLSYLGVGAIYTAFWRATQPAWAVWPAPWHYTALDFILWPVALGGDISERWRQ